jgi:DNA topoisomerase-3
MKMPITKCPCCNSNMYENKYFFYCEKWNDSKNKCDFSIKKTIAGKEITTENAIDICTSGRSLLISGFISKKGKPFSAFLKLVKTDDTSCKKKISFEFPEKG